MGAAPLIIPLVALVIPILLLLAAIAFGVVYISWAVYRGWHEREHGRFLGRLLHRSP